jgi:hypothetical protein
MVKVTFKLATGAKFDMDVEGSMTVATLKDLIADLANVPPPNQRMVFKGQVRHYPSNLQLHLLSPIDCPHNCLPQVLKDPNTADSYSMVDGDIVHIVTVSTPAGQAAPAPATSAPAPVHVPSTAAPPSSADPFAALLGQMPFAAPNAGANPFGAGANPFGAMMGNMGGANMPDMASMQAMMQENPEMMAAMMDNPMVQQALDNPGKNRGSAMTRDVLTCNAQPSSRQ